MYIHWSIHSLQKEGKMLRITTKTKLTTGDVIANAVKFFGPEGYKLKITNQTETSANFEGSGGFVEISACDDKGKTTVDFTANEWDYQVKEFIHKLR
jgi:hypothetical protein